MTSDGFGALLREHRRAAGLSQRELAGRAGVSIAALRDLEQGRTRRPQLRSAAALITAVGGTGNTAAALRARSGPMPGRQAPGRVRIRALGPLTVLHGSTEVRLTGKRRVLAGRLALSPGVPVPVAELMDLLWPRRVPREPAGALHAHVSRLRRTVEPVPSAGGTLHPISDGYRLTMSDDELDVRQFRRAAADAHVLVAACPEAAVGMLEAALHLWRGSPCADVEQLVHHPSAAMLREERVAAVLLLADLAAALRQYGRSLPHLRALATEQPLHEPLYARLIAALAAPGCRPRRWPRTRASADAWPGTSASTPAPN